MRQRLRHPQLEEKWDQELQHGEEEPKGKTQEKLRAPQQEHRHRPHQVRHPPRLTEQHQEHERLNQKAQPHLLLLKVEPQQVWLHRVHGCQSPRVAGHKVTLSASLLRSCGLDSRSSRQRTAPPQSCPWTRAQETVSENFSRNVVVAGQTNRRRRWQRLWKEAPATVTAAAVQVVRAVPCPVRHAGGWLSPRPREASVDLSYRSASPAPLCRGCRETPVRASCAMRCRCPCWIHLSVASTVWLVSGVRSTSTNTFINTPPQTHVHQHVLTHTQIFESCVTCCGFFAVSTERAASQLTFTDWSRTTDQ